MPVLLTVLTTGLAATSSTYPARATNALGPRCASAAMVAAAVARLPGMPSPQDDGAFSDDPAGFCAKGLLNEAAASLGRMPTSTAEATVGLPRVPEERRP